MSNITVKIGSDDRRIEPFSGRKVNRALRLLREIASNVPDLLTKRAEFVRDYQAENYVELDRTAAIQRFGQEMPVLDPETGQPIVREDGSMVTVKSAVASMTDADWAASGNKLRMPKSPEFGEIMWALFPEILDQAEETVVELLALVLMPNDEVKKASRDGSLNDSKQARQALEQAETQRADAIARGVDEAQLPKVDAEAGRGKLWKAGQDLLDDALGDQLIELAVAAGEVIDDQLLSKARRLADEGRLGNVLRLFGLDPDSLKTKKEEETETAATETEPTPEPTPNSSSASPEPSPASGKEKSSTT